MPAGRLAQLFVPMIVTAPIKVEDVELPGVPSTIGYMPITTGIEKIAENLIKKLKNQ